MEILDVTRELTLALINNGRLVDAKEVNAAFAALLEAQVAVRAALDSHKTYSQAIQRTEELAQKYRAGTAQ